MNKKLKSLWLIFIAGLGINLLMLGNVMAQGDLEGNYSGHKRNLPPPPPPGSEPSPTPLPGSSPPPEPTPLSTTESTPAPSPSPSPSPESTPSPSPEQSPPPSDGNGNEPPPTNGGSESGSAPPPPIDIHNLSPEELKELTAEDGSSITPEQGGTLTPDQLGHIPPDAIAGFPPDTLLAMPPDTVHALSPEQIKNINSEDFQTSSDNEIGKFFINLDHDKVKPEDAEGLLPSDWHIDPTSGELTPPPGTQITLPDLEPGSTPGFNPPDQIPDLSKSFSLGGENGTSFIDKANQSLGNAGLSDFQFSQDSNSGKIIFNQSSTDSKYSLAPDANGIYQSESGSGSGLNKDKNGFYQLTTDDAQQLTLRPVPADPAALGTALNGKVHLGEKGNVLIDASVIAISAIFGSEITQMPDGTPAGPMVQDDGSYIYVFDDGQAQTVYPTPNEPDLLITLLLASINGLSSLSYNADGSISGIYNGRPVTILTGFEGEVKSVDEDTDNSSGSLTFNQIENDGSLVLLYRSPIPESDSTTRARVSDTDVEQRVSITYDESDEDSSSTECLSSTAAPENFLSFIETMTNCKFIVY